MKLGLARLSVSEIPLFALARMATHLVVSAVSHHRLAAASSGITS